MTLWAPRGWCRKRGGRGALASYHYVAGGLWSVCGRLEYYRSAGPRTFHKGGDPHNCANCRRLKKALDAREVAA